MKPRDSKNEKKTTVIAMKIQTIKTRLLVPPKDDLFDAIKGAVKKIPERSILAIASKAVSIGEGRCVWKKNFPVKDDLIIMESDKYLPRDLVPEKRIIHTFKNNVFIPSAGIDESNGNGYYIFWPKNPLESAKKLWLWAQSHFRIKNFGIIITDSHSIPQRRGVIGISLAHYGFSPLKDYRGRRDLFGKKLKVSQTNLADCLASSAIAVMGEGDEQTPLCLFTDIDFIHFTNSSRNSRKKYSSFEVKKGEDLYRPLFDNLPWKKGGKGFHAPTNT